MTAKEIDRGVYRHGSRQGERHQCLGADAALETNAAKGGTLQFCFGFIPASGRRRAALQLRNGERQVGKQGRPGKRVPPSAQSGVS